MNQNQDNQQHQVGHADAQQQPPVEGPSPSESPQPEPAGQSTQAPHSAKFFQWIRSLRIRRGPNRWIGGVCSGLAEKWNIDPVIVRGLAVVLSLFFGVGLLAYGVAWALLPEPDQRIHAEEVTRGAWTAGTTGAAASIFFGLAGPGQSLSWSSGDRDFSWGGLLVGGIIAVAIWAIISGRSSRPNHQRAQAPAMGEPIAAYGPHGPAGPLGSARAQQITELKRRNRLGAPVTLLTFGLSVIVGAVILLLNQSGTLSLGGFAIATAFAGAAITMGMGIIISGFTGRTAGGLGTLSIIGLVLAGLASIGPVNLSSEQFSNQVWKPTTEAAAQVGYSAVFGNSTLDLTSLVSSSTLDADVVVPIEVAASNVTIKVPTSIPVTVTSELAAGNLKVQGSGDGNRGALLQSTTKQINPKASGKGIIINLDGMATNVTIVPVAGK